ncbi:ATP-binding protein [Methanobrevibacter sp.]|uniref:ATP-binding protein n=1 Tax=Methanobrevibacter sp. TaxID=66852 RepID=UPI003891185A
MVNRKLYLDRVCNFIDKDVIKIITGIRRCGKSYLFKLIIQELKKRGVDESDILLIDFELPEYNSIETREQLDEIVLKFLEGHENRVYLLFDEIQNVKKWEVSINSYYKLGNADIYITGSNSKLMSKEFSTLLTGRFVNIEMYPFSFNEFLDYKRELEQTPFISNELNSDLENYFEEFRQYGGLPLTISSESDKELVLNGIYSSIVLNDVVERYEIRNIGIFNRVVRYIIENAGNLISANAVYTYLKHENLRITKQTIYNYLEYLENAYMISKATREDLASKKEIVGSEKYYLIDTGFYKSQLDEKQHNIGNILENIVFLELKRNGYKITIGNVNGCEVDFVCKRNNQKIYIQVAYLMEDDETVEREFLPLLMISDNYPKYVLSMDRILQPQNGVKHMNIIDFLRNFNHDEI